MTTIMKWNEKEKAGNDIEVGEMGDGDGEEGMGFNLWKSSIVGGLNNRDFKLENDKREILFRMIKVDFFFNILNKK